MKDELILAHYYTTPDVQAAADYVGDSLELALKAAEEKPKRIVFAGVRFMAETVKILNPDAEVILPDSDSTCSLVKQTDVKALKEWVRGYPEHVHVAYINSSAEHKATADIIVTSRIVDDVIKDITGRLNREVIFSPDRNMGLYINSTYGYNMPVWHAVCEVHDKFTVAALENAINPLYQYNNYILAHPESPLPVLEQACYVGSTKGMLDWINNFSAPHFSSVIWVATEDGLLHNMRQLRPELDIRQAPVDYKGCQCNSCPYMKLNTIDKFNNGEVIDYMSDRLMEAARKPIERMLMFEKSGRVIL